MIKLERSPEYFLKNQLIKDEVIINHRMIKDQLGDLLAEVLFETAVEPQRSLLGLDLRLEGPSDDIWQSPHDYLIGDVKHTPWHAVKMLEDLNYLTLCEIALRFHKRLDNSYKDETLRLCQKFKEAFLKIAPGILARRVRRTLMWHKVKFNELLEKIKAMYTKTMMSVLQDLYCKLQNRNIQAIEKMKADLERCWNRKVVLAVKYAVYELAQRFAEQLQDQQDDAYEVFKMIFTDHHLKFTELHHAEELRYENEFNLLENECKCEHITELLEVHANENEKSIRELKEREKQLKATVAAPKAQLHDTEACLEKLKKDIDDCDDKIKAKSNTLILIVEEFLNFVDFAMESVPSEGNYLMDLKYALIQGLRKSIEMQKLSIISNESIEIEEPKKQRRRSIIHKCEKGPQEFVFDNQTYTRAVFPRKGKSRRSSIRWSTDLHQLRIDLQRVIRRAKVRETQIRFSNDVEERMLPPEPQDSLIVIKKKTSWQKSFLAAPMFATAIPPAMNDSSILRQSKGNHNLAGFEISFGRRTPLKRDPVNKRRPRSILVKPEYVRNKRPQSILVNPNERRRSTLSETRDSVELLRLRMPKSCRAMSRLGDTTDSIDLAFQRIPKFVPPNVDEMEDIDDEEAKKRSVARDSFGVTKLRMSKALNVPEARRLSTEPKSVHPNLDPEEKYKLNLKSRDSLTIHKKKLAEETSKESLPVVRKARTSGSPQTSLNNKPPRSSLKIIDETISKSTRKLSLNPVGKNRDAVRMSLIPPCAAVKVSRKPPLKNEERETRDSLNSSDQIPFKSISSSHTVSSKSQQKRSMNNKGYQGSDLSLTGSLIVPLKTVRLSIKPEVRTISSIGSSNSPINRRRAFVKKNEEILREFIRDKILSENPDEDITRGRRSTFLTMDNVIKQFQDTENVELKPHDPIGKSVGISHVEKIPIENRKSVAFDPADPRVIICKKSIDGDKEPSLQVKPKRTITKRDNFLTKPNAITVAGNYYKRHISGQNFERNRTESFARIFKERPSLCNLFIQ